MTLGFFLCAILITPNINKMEADQLSKTLLELSKCENEMSIAEREAEIFRIRKTQRIYASRRSITSEIPQFWYIVLAENDDFAEYIRAEDLKYLDFISDIYVHHDIAEDGPDGAGLGAGLVATSDGGRGFSITITFKDSSNTVPSQAITKKFSVHLENGEEKITAESVDVEWPADLSEICPSKIRKNKANDAYTADEKKRYRQGMKSFFAWFEWTGKRPGKEFKCGEDLTRLLLDDLFPNAVKYYVEAINNDQESDVDSSEGEELDLSDEDGTPERKKQRV